MLIIFLPDIMHYPDILVFYSDRNMRYCSGVFMSFPKVRTEEAVNQTQTIQSETPNRNSELSGSISQNSDKMCKSVSKDHGEWYL